MNDFFSPEQKKRIVDSIKKAELRTSGEIRVHIESLCKKNVLDRAAQVFAMLKMHKTKLRNGVLFYFSVKDKKFAILGDAGINSKTEIGFWDEISILIEKNFREGNFVEGLSQGIEMAGEKLKTHFPYQSDDVNELSDEISFS